jgi:hypothetical protein
MQRLLLAAALLVTPAALAGSISMDLNSSVAANIAGADIVYEVDDMLGVEVLKRTNIDGWVWPAADITLTSPVALMSGAELQIHARYHQVDNPTADPPRPAYDDANIWMLLYDGDGTEWDLSWGEAWTADEWKTQVKEIDLAAAPLDFDTANVSMVRVRATNWRGVPEEDFIAMSNLTITPEPASLALVGLGLLGLLRRR